MNRSEAKQLAEKVTLEELRQMMNTAKEKVPDWTIASRVNKGLSLGITYNIFTAGWEKYSSEKDIHILAKTNMIWAFGEYFPGYTKKVRKEKQEVVAHHQDPKFVEL
jgi:hypothetical protein